MSYSEKETKEIMVSDSGRSAIMTCTLETGMKSLTAEIQVGTEPISELRLNAEEAEALSKWLNSRVEEMRKI